MKYIYFFILSLLSLISLQASDFEMPDKLRQLEFTTDNIPERLVVEEQKCRTNFEYLEFYKKHPALKYEDKDILEKKFEAVRKNENELQKQLLLTWFGLNAEKQNQLLKAYLALAEKGCEQANYRLAEAFKKGELGLPVNLYWERVFSNRNCSRKFVEIAVEFYTKRVSGRADESNDENLHAGYRKSSKDSSSDNSDDTDSTQRLSDEIEYKKDEDVSDVNPQSRQECSYTLGLRHRNVNNKLPK